MVRAVVLLGAAVVVFCGTLLGAAFLSGNVTQADLDRLFGREPAGPVEDTPMIDGLSTTARMLRDKEELLREREEELNEREKRILQQEVENRALLQELQQVRTEIAESLDQADEQRQANISAIAESLASMEAVAAAAALSALLKDEPTVAVDVVKQIPKRQRGELLSNLPPEDSRALFLQIQEPVY